MTTNTSPITPATTALMLMDFQPMVLASINDPDALLDRAHAALAWARSENVRVVYVRVAFTPEDYTTIPTHNKAFAAVATNKLLADGSPGSEIDAEKVFPHQADVIRTNDLSALGKS
jgi:nicotinamidase-related amidase